MIPNTEPAATIARFIVESQWQDLPAGVRHHAKRALLNFVGAAIGGSQDAAIAYSIAVLGRFSGPPQAGVLGRSERFDMLTAAFLNAAGGNVLDFDDTHHPTVVHPTSPVAPPLLAMAETARMSGTELLHALALGIEVACRLGNVVGLQHYIRGWHITSTCGVVGAAAAAAKALRLDLERTIWALGIAANQACGLVETLGSMAKSVSVGNAARNGLLAGMLAQEGFTSAPTTLDGPRGFARVLSDTPDFSALTDGLGQRWEIEHNALKPYPSGVVLHPVVDACLALRAGHAIAAERIARVRVRGHPLLRQRADRPAPASSREAAVSVQHSVAVCFLHGDAGVRQYTDARANDAGVRALGSKVTIEEDAAIAVEAAEVSVELADGRRHSIFVEHALGSLAQPMTDAQVEAKVKDCAVWRRFERPIEPLIDAVWRLDESDDAAGIVRLLTTG